MAQYKIVKRESTTVGEMIVADRIDRKADAREQMAEIAQGERTYPSRVNWTDKRESVSVRWEGGWNVYEIREHNEDAERLERVAKAADQQITDFLVHLAGSKFREDTTIQVSDVQRWLLDIRVTLNG